MKALRRAAAVVLLLAGCESAALAPRDAAEVYEFRLPTQPPLVLRWPSGSTIHVYVAGGDVPGQAAALTAALQQGMAAWNQHALFGEYRLAATADLGRADVVLRWAGEVSPVDLSQCLPSGIQAVTTFCLENGQEPAQGLAVFPRADGGSSRVRMVVSVLAAQLAIPGRVPMLVSHELGHVLGLSRHTDEPRDLMYGGQLTTAVPTARDRATVQVLYQMRADVTP